MTFQEACEWIWEEQLGNVMKTANRIAKEWPGSDPDDILQDLILHCADLFERRFDPVKSTKVTYLINILKFAPAHFRRVFGREVKKHERCLQIEAFLEDQLEREMEILDKEELDERIANEQKLKKQQDAQLRAFYKLPQRTQDMLKLRAEGWTLLKISEEFHISKERVRQIVNDGIRKAKELTLKKEEECTSNLA